MLCGWIDMGLFGKSGKCHGLQGNQLQLCKAILKSLQDNLKEIDNR
jgi:hypothetical protein